MSNKKSDETVTGTDLKIEENNTQKIIDELKAQVDLLKGT